MVAIVTMHSFSERIRVQDCKRLLHELDPLDLVEYLRFLPIEKVNTKKGVIEIVYIHNPRARFGGRAKTKVTVTSGENSLRLQGSGPLSFELRLSCTNNQTMVIYLTVTGKLIDKVPKTRARELFEALVAELRTRGGGEELPPATLPEAAPAAAPAQPAPVPLAAAAAAQPSPASPMVQQPTGPLPSALPAAAPAPAAAAPGPGGGEDLAACIVRLITAGFPVDEELSRRVPVEFSPRLRTLPVAAHGYEPSERVNLIEYDDADYVIRLVSGDVRVDVVRLGGVVGVYYRGPDGEAYGDEAAKRAAEKLCRPGRRIAYTVARLS